PGGGLRDGRCDAASGVPAAGAAGALRLRWLVSAVTPSRWAVPWLAALVTVAACSRADRPVSPSEVVVSASPSGAATAPAASPSPSPSDAAPAPLDEPAPAP